MPPNRLTKFMKYYSHVLYFPNTHPFDKEDHKWPSFVGEFILPIVRLGLHENYWCSFYTSHAKLRILTDRYGEIEPKLVALQDSLRLVDKGEEKDLTLVEDLGGHRFIEPSRTDKKAEERAMLVLRHFQSICDLYADLLIKGEDGYWGIEKSTDDQNFGDNVLVSCMHIVGNIGQFQFPLELYVRTPWMGCIGLQCRIHV